MWRPGNAAQIAGCVSGAFNELCDFLGVEDACGQAISLASELMLGGHPGISIPPAANDRQYDFTQAYGSWATAAGTIDRKGGNIYGKDFLDGHDPDEVTVFEDLRKRLVGFNFGVQTPLHRSPTSFEKVQYTIRDRKVTKKEAGVDVKYVINDAVTGTWQRNGFTNAIAQLIPQYNTYTTSSLTRLSIDTGLIATHHQHINFSAPSSMANFINMQRLALYANMSLFLASNDIDARMWVGWYDFARSTNLSTLYQQIMSSISQDTLVFINMNRVTQDVNEWSHRYIESYYSMDPTTDLNWSNSSNFPIHFYIQWKEKLGLARGGTPLLNLRYSTHRIGNTKRVFYSQKITLLPTPSYRALLTS